MEDKRQSLPPRPNLPPRPGSPAPNSFAGPNTIPPRPNPVLNNQPQKVEQSQNVEKLDKQKKEKKPKTKKIKQEKNKKEIKENIAENSNLEDQNNSGKKSKKKLVKIIVIASACLVLAIGIAIGILYIQNENKLNKQLEIGNAKITVYQLSDKVYLQAQKAECEKYIFEISNQNSVCFVKTSKPFFDISNYIEKGERYTFKYYIQGQREKSKSLASQSETLVVLNQLQTPSISLSEDKASIVWQKVENAQRYVAMYFNKTTNAVVSIPVPNTTEDLVTFAPNLSEGEYFIQIVAQTNQNGFVNSEPSNFVRFIEKTQEIAPTSVVVNRDDCTVTVNMPATDYIPTFMICIGEDVYSYKASSLLLSYTISLNNFVNTIPMGQTVGVSVVARSEFYENSLICNE